MRSFGILLGVLFLLVDVARAHRIVSLDPSLTELLFAIGVGDQIVGTTEFSDQPAAARAVPRVGGYDKPSLEKIFLANPSIVVALREGEDWVSAPLKKRGVKLVTFESRDLPDFSPLVQKLGEVFNRQVFAESVVRQWNKDWDDVEKLSSKMGRRHVLIQVDQNPLVLAGQGTFVSSALQKCGQLNALAPKNGYLKLAVEKLVETAADSVVVLQMTDSTNETGAANFWRGLPPFLKTPIVFAKADDLARLVPRLPQKTLELCQKIKAAEAAP